MLRKVVLFGAISALSVAWASPASAAFIAFDPTGGGSSALTIDLLDPAPGNSISLNGGALGLGGVGAKVEVLFQANLGIADNSTTAGADYANGQAGHFFTFVAGSPQVVTGLGAVTTTSFDPAGAAGAPNATNFFYIYSTTVSTDIVAGGVPNDRSGICFTCGTLILSGVITNSTSSFKEDLANSGGPLDQFGTDNYPGIISLAGTGGFNASILVTSADKGYFPNLISGALIDWSAQTKTNLPYQQVDPSACFSLTGLASCTYGGAGTANIGPANGLGKDIMLSQDAALSFNGVAAVPEPATLLLVGGGLLAASRRRMLKGKK